MQQFENTRWRTAAVALATLALSVCGGSGKGGGGGEVPTVPVTPTPTPVATPPTAMEPISASCTRVPEGSERYTCRTESATFMAEVNDAINEVKAAHPEYFSGDRVLNIGGYYLGVIKALDQKGLCATFDGEELAVRNADNYNDQYDLLTSADVVRRYYVNTCYPAVFPLARGPRAPSPAGCTLAPSYELACGMPSPQFASDVEAAVEQIIRERPELFDMSRMAPGREWPFVKDLQAYQQGVVDILMKKGYCGMFDGEEIEIKRSNEFSEHYDINYADQYVRTGPGSYRSACYPAAF